MREKRFRAWDEDREEYCYRYNPVTHGEIDILKLGLFFKSINYILEEYIGHPDKEGAELCEGDIVDIYEKRWNDELDDLEEISVGRDVVTLEHFRMWLEHESFGYEGEDLISPEDTKIVGNIHQHSELLESKD